MTDSEIIRMGYSIQAFLKKENLNAAKPKDVMGYLIQREYFNSDYRAGLPLRKMLRNLDEENKLYLLPNLIVERKDKNRFWSFVMLNN